MDELVRWAPLTPNMILAQLKASWRRQRFFLLDGINKGWPQHPTEPWPVEAALWEKGFLMDGTVKKRPKITSMVLAL